MIDGKRIDFNQLAKPTNLQNSAVLRMLEEEEERKKLGKAGLKRVAWPPPAEDQDYAADFVEQGPVQAKTRGIGEYATFQCKSPTLLREEDPNLIRQQQQQQQQLQQQQQQQQLLLQQQQQQQKPKTWTPVSGPQISYNAVPSSWKSTDLPDLDGLNSRAAPQVQEPQSFGTWSKESQDIRNEQTIASSPSFLKTWNEQPQQTLIVAQDHQQQQQLHQQQQQPSGQPEYQPSHNRGTHHFEPPATLITLRPEPPISQEPSPVYQAQPAAINPTSGSMRGDQKWPPASVKEQTEAENQARIELAKGPIFRPRRVNKDYTGFFSQHASTNNYPGYRAPPGTQYFTPAYQH